MVDELMVSRLRGQCVRSKVGADSVCIYSREGEDIQAPTGAASIAPAPSPPGRGGRVSMLSSQGSIQERPFSRETLP